MNNLYYPQTPSREKPAAPTSLPPFAASKIRDPSGYIPDEGLVAAVNVALVLHQPLLLTGEPGTGKSELAYSVAWELGLDPPLVFETKSTSQAKDLFYSYDTVGRYLAGQLKTDLREPKEYITLNALGEAIVRTRDSAEIGEILPSEFKYAGRRRSVVLIDEVEKAPRDFPNDILNEMERMYFRIVELGNIKVEADPNLSPVVVLTNNSERALPDAFLRRCVYYNIPFPDREQLERIVLQRVRNSGAMTPLLHDAISFFMRVREPAAGLDKRPGTAELLNWVIALHQFGADSGRRLREQSLLARQTLSTIAKLADDQSRLDTVFANWTTDS